jgi:hypothetical protein
MNLFAQELWHTGRFLMRVLAAMKEYENNISSILVSV